MLAMNLLDMLIIATMCVMIVRGIFRGFFRETGSLAGVILGIWIGNVCHPTMTRYLQHYLPAVSYLPLLGFTLIFLMVLLACNVAGWGLSVLSKKIFLSWVDRALGAGLAVLKGIILTYLAMVLLTFFVPSQTPLVAGSNLAPVIIRSYQSMIGVVSPESYQKWKNKFYGYGKQAYQDLKKKNESH